MTIPRSATPRWVLDTNVVLSALVHPGGVCGKLRLAWQSQRFAPVVSRFVVEELLRVLAYPKFRLTQAEQHDLLADYLPWVDTVRIPSPPPVTPKCRDPHDVPFLELALAGKAHALVTGDSDLKVVAPVPGLEILTPAEAVAWLSG